MFASMIHWLTIQYVTLHLTGTRETSLPRTVQNVSLLTLKYVTQIILSRLSTFETGKYTLCWWKGLSLPYFRSWWSGNAKWNGKFPIGPVRPEKWSSSKGGPNFPELFQLGRTDPFSFEPKFSGILVKWIAPTLNAVSIPNHVFLIKGQASNKHWVSMVEFKRNPWCIY